MKVKELINELKKYDEDKDVIIGFVVNNKGYIVEPKIVDERLDDIAIYSEYNDKEEYCNFIGQKNLTKLWEEGE